MRPNLFRPAALAGLAIVFGAPSSGQAQEGAEFLLLPVGARAVGMGGAVTGMRGIGELVLWNPAGVAGMAERRLLFNHSESAFDTRSEVLSLAWPTHSIGTFAITYYLVDYGELTSTGVDGSVTGTINFRNQEFLLSFATRVAGPLEAGLNYKVIQLIYRCDGVCAGTQSFTRTTHAVDLGLIWNGLAGLPLSLGGSVRHLGFALEGDDEDDPLPTRVRLGAAYRINSAFTSDSTLAVAFAVDLEDQARDLGDPDVMVGSEFSVADLFFVRAGYAFLDTGPGGASLGLGLTYDWFYLDLSRGFDEVSTATGEDAIQVSFGIIF
ncbi:MAG: PorV/PorQ family protein [Gemmatimonadota bacterium]|nr:MAG: PorV/PorQ family protein [Gemmatimonadota bacterium]